MIQRSFRRVSTIALLLLFLVLWLFPEWFGLSGSRPVRKSDGSMVTVRDGDTLSIAKQDFRLYGIDAPEFSQICKDANGTDWPCGKAAREGLVELLGTSAIDCEERATDKYNRIVATCRTRDGVDLAKAMIERGLAVSFGGFAEGPYAADEGAAKDARRGLWQGTFDPPSSWRATHPRL